MQFTSAFLALLAATTALAAPAPVAAPEAVEIEARQSSNQIRIQISGDSELARQFTFNSNGKRQTQNIGETAKIRTVSLELGNKVNQKLRCQILDKNGRAITVKRGANTDTTFADGDKGAWTLSPATAVGRVICDPAFKQRA